MTGKEEASIERPRGLELSPRLPVFSGGDRDTDYYVWEYEVRCLISEKYDDAGIRALIRRSLKGQASQVLMGLGTEASVEDILEKFEAVFGTTQTAQTVLSNFYSARQDKNEDAGAFAFRIETILNQAVRLKRVKPGETNDLLIEAFKNGLSPQTRLACSWLFGQHSNFNKLRVEVKRHEQELGILNPVQVKSVQDSQIESLTAEVKSLRASLNELRGASGPMQFAGPRPVRPSFQPRGVDGVRPRFTGQGPRYSGAPPPRGRDPPTCYRCGMVGHVKKGCRMPLPDQGNF